MNLAGQAVDFRCKTLHMARRRGDGTIIQGEQDTCVFGHKYNAEQMLGVVGGVILALHIISMSYSFSCVTGLSFSGCSPNGL